jgi:hypothetical protein
MAYKLSQKKQEQLYDDMVQRLTQSRQGMFDQQSIANRMYPNLKGKPEPEQPNRRAPVDGWAKQRKEWE